MNLEYIQSGEMKMIMRRNKMAKAYAVGDYSYKMVSETIDMINTNCDADGEERIPMKFYHQYNVSDVGWYIECLNEEDEPRLEKHLNYIFQLN